jgi:hypothetical protein
MLAFEKRRMPGEFSLAAKVVSLRGIGFGEPNSHDCG